MASSIFKSSSLYAAGTIARTASSIIMLPIYTRYLTPDIYGTAELLNLILDLTILLLGARITTGMFKFHSDAKTPQEKTTVLSTCLWLGLAVNTFAIILLWLLAPVIANLLGNPEISPALRWFSFTLAFGTVGEIGMGRFRIFDQAGRYLGFSLFKLCLQVSASIYFIVYLELGLWGIIYSTLTSSAIHTLALYAHLLPLIGLRYSKKLAVKLIKYSLPIIYGSLAMYYMTFGDRFFIQHFNGINEVGIYALGYKFGFMLAALAWAPFMTYWGARQFEHAKAENSATTFSEMFYSANYLLWIAATGMVLFSGPVLKLIANPSYYSAIDIIPYIVIAYTFQCWTEFHRFGLLDSGDTKALNRFTWYTAILITALYLILIPNFGGIGAAGATAIAMLFRFVLVYRKSQDYFSFYTSWHKIILLIIISILALLLFTSRQSGTVEDLYISAVIFLGAMMASFFLKLTPQVMINKIKSVLIS